MTNGKLDKKLTSLKKFRIQIPYPIYFKYLQGILEADKFLVLHSSTINYDEIISN